MRARVLLELIVGSIGDTAEQLTRIFITDFPAIDDFEQGFQGRRRIGGDALQDEKDQAAPGQSSGFRDRRECRGAIWAWNFNSPIMENYNSIIPCQEIDHGR